MGHLHIERGVWSKAEGFPRTLRIYTPDQYDWDDTTVFGLVLMHDAQNLFEHPETWSHPSWAAEVALQGLLDEGRVGPWLIVGVDHGAGRFEDFSPWDEPRAQVKGRAENYARFLTGELLPELRRHYRLRTGAPWTATMGSSLGGLVSLFLHWRHPEVFGRVGALSPSVMWCEDGLFRHWTKHTERWTRIYLDAGETEVLDRSAFLMKYGEKVHEFFHHLEQLGYEPHELAVVLEPGAIHSEADWRRRLPAAMEWLLRE